MRTMKSNHFIINKMWSKVEVNLLGCLPIIYKPLQLDKFCFRHLCVDKLPFRQLDLEKLIRQIVF